MKVLVATRNRGKVAELAHLFADVEGIELVGLDDVGSLAEVEEDAETFEGNALKKARELALASGLVTLADDSGLEVDALNGEPGVRSARYAHGHDDAANNAKLLAAMRDVPDDRRSARFRCVLAFFDPERDELLVAHGKVEGRIARAPRGGGGFGYDPLFFVDERTMAELTPEQKSVISHRADAARALIPLLRAYLAR
jgi:XTP/dITP diphosphohydrolase